jgi:hypothetical protein
VETLLYNIAAELNDLCDQLHRAEQEREQTLVIAEDVQATIRHLDQEMARLETALAAIRTGAARLRKVVGCCHTELPETKLVD